MGFTGEVAFAFVVNLSGVASAGLDSVGFGQLDVWATPDDTLNPKLGCVDYY